MKPLLAGVLALMLAACTASGIPAENGHPCLRVSRFPSAIILGQYRLPERGEFSLSFIHSVSRTPVRDDYRILGNRIVQTAETFQTHGAGLPSEIDEDGVTDWETRDGRFVIRMERSIPRLIVRTDGNYRNRLIIGSQEINLNAWEDQALELAIVFCTDP